MRQSRRHSSKKHVLGAAAVWLVLVVFSLSFAVDGVSGAFCGPSFLDAGQARETSILYGWMPVNPAVGGDPYTLKYWIDENDGIVDDWDVHTISGLNTPRDPTRIADPLGGVNPSYKYWLEPSTMARSIEDSKGNVLGLYYFAEGLFSKTTYVGRAHANNCDVWSSQLRLDTANTDCRDWNLFPQIQKVTYKGIGPNTCEVQFYVYGTVGSGAGVYGNYYRVSPSSSEKPITPSPIPLYPALPTWQVDASSSPVTWQFEYDDGKADCDLDYGLRYTYSTEAAAAAQGHRLNVGLNVMRRDAGTASDMNLRVSAYGSPPGCSIEYWDGTSWVYSGTDSGFYAPGPTPTPPKLVGNAEVGNTGSRTYEVDFCGDSEVTTNAILDEQCDPPGSTGCIVPGMGIEGKCDNACKCVPKEGDCKDLDKDGSFVTGGACGPVDCDDNPDNSALGGGKWVNPGYSDQDGFDVTGGCNGVDNDCDGVVDEDYGWKTCGSGLDGCSGNLYCSSTNKVCVAGCRLGGSAEICTTIAYAPVAIYPDHDCGYCCVCSGGTPASPKPVFDKSQEAVDCRISTCNAAGGCGRDFPWEWRQGCGENLWMHYEAVEAGSTCEGVNQCSSTTCVLSCSNTDFDGDGYSAECGDCRDNDKDISPAATEGLANCDGLDNDCDGLFDEGYPSPGPACDKDCIGDGFSNCVNGAVRCEKNPAVACSCAGGTGCS